MALNFCRRCKTLMNPHNHEGKILLRCSNCDFSEELKEGSLKVRDKIKKSKKLGEGIASEENILADFEHKCKKCGHDKVQILDMGVFVSDEDNLIMLKCGKCGFSERVGRRTS